MKIFNFTDSYNSWTIEKLNSIKSFKTNSEDTEFEVIEVKSNYNELSNPLKLLKENSEQLIQDLALKISNMIYQDAVNSNEYEIYLLFDNSIPIILFYHIVSFISVKSSNDFLIHLILEYEKTYSVIKEAYLV